MTVSTLAALIVPLFLAAVILLVLYFVIRGAVLSALRIHAADRARPDAGDSTIE
jgi:hypothetical protein